MIFTLPWKKISSFWDRQQVFCTLLVGFLGGYVFFLLGTPLAWLMGAMLFTAVSGCFGMNVLLPGWFRRIGFFTIGIVLGQRFTEQLVSVIFDSFLLMITIGVLFIGIGFLNAWLLWKWFKMEWITALFGCAPGGVSEMVLVGSELGGDGKSIAVLQSTRVFMVVILVPFIAMSYFPKHITTMITEERSYHLSGLLILFLAGIAGVLVGKRLRLPAIFLLGPLITTAFLTFFNLPTSDIPLLWQYLGQVFVGSSIGMGFKREDLLKIKKIFVAGFLINLFLLVMSTLMAILIASFCSIDFLTALLSTAPGGIAEMSMTALLMGGNVAIVTAFQVFRMLVIVTIFPLIVKKMSKHGKENAKQQVAK